MTGFFPFGTQDVMVRLKNDGGCLLRKKTGQAHTLWSSPLAINIQ
jgi:hypothetical protein